MVAGRDDENDAMPTKRPKNDTIRIEFGEPSSRVLSQWSIDQVRIAEALADGGSLRLAADLCEALQKDDAVLGPLSTRVRGLLGLDLTFEASGDRRRRGRAIKALEVGEDWWASYPEDQLTDLLTWAIVLGVGLGEQVWTPHAGRIVPRLKVWHPRWLRWDWNERRWLLTTLVGEIPIEPGDGKWVLLTPGGPSRPWAHGAWRALSRWFLLKSFAIDDWGRYSERQGQGVLVATPPDDDSNEKRRKQLSKDISELGRDTAIVMPPGFKLSVVESVAKTYETFKDQIACSDMGMTIALKGQNLTTKVEGGSFAAADTHQGIDFATARSDGEVLSTTLHDQGLAWWAEFNFGDRDLAPWPQWDTDEPEDLAARAGTLKTAGEALAGLKTAGVNVDTDAFAEEFRIPIAPGAPPPAPAPVPAVIPAPQPGASRFALRLASGDAVPNASGFVNGQLYADAVADSGTLSGRDALAPDLASVIAAIDAATDYEDLRRRLLDAYGQMSSEKLARLMERALILAEFAGRAAVVEDL